MGRGHYSRGAHNNETTQSTSATVKSPQLSATMDDPLRNEIQPPRPVIQPSVADANQASENNTDSLAINPDNQLAASAYLLLDHLNNKINAVGSFLSEMAESPTEVNPLDRINDAALEFANTIRGLWANQETADDPQMTDTQVNPMNDLTKLITKLWSSQSSPTTENVTNAQVMDKLTEITKRLDELEAKSKTPPPRTSEGQATLKDLASVMEGFTKMAQSLELLHRRIVEVKWNSIDGRQVMTEDIYQRLREHQTAMEERLDEDMAAMQEHIDKRNEWVMEKIAQKISEQVARQQAKQSEELQLFKRAVVGAMVQKQEQPEKKAPQPKRTSGYENYYGPMSLRPNDVALMFPTPPLGSGVGSKMNKTTSNTEEKSGFPFKCDYCYGQRFPTKLFFDQHMAHMHAHIPKPSRPVTDPVRESDLFSTTIPSSSPPASPFQGSSLNRSRYPHVSPELAALSKRLQSVLNPSPPVPDYSQYPPHHGFGSGPQIQKAPNTNPSAPLPNHSQHQPNHRFGYGPQLQKPANTNTNTLPPAVNHSQHPQHHNTSSGQPRNQPNIGLSAVTGEQLYNGDHPGLPPSTPFRRGPNNASSTLSQVQTNNSNPQPPLEQQILASHRAHRQEPSSCAGRPAGPMLSPRGNLFVDHRHLPPPWGISQQSSAVFGGGDGGRPQQPSSKADLGKGHHGEKEGSVKVKMNDKGSEEEEWSYVEEEEDSSDEEW